MLGKTTTIAMTLTAALLLCPILTAHAAVTTPRDSAAFSYQYEMDVLPTADDQGGAAGGDWTFSGAVPPLVAGGVMTWAFPPAGPDAGEFNNSDTGLVDFDTGYTYEIRARVVSSPSFWSMGNIALPGLGHNDQIPFLQFGSSRTTWGESGALDTNDNTDGFHTFRFAQEPGSGTYSVWRDGVLLSGTLTSARGDLGGLGLRKIAFGDQGGEWQGTTDIDYVRFDVTGAYAPIPEPSSCVLVTIGLGGLLLAWKRRRRA